MTATTTIILMLYFIRGSLGHVLPQSPIVGIEGGYSVNIEDAPFMVALLEVGGSPYDAEVSCGGSIIHKQFVLTSAYCTKLKERKKEKSLIVRVGSSRYDEGGQLHQVEKYIIHESYYSPTDINNVGLLKLSEPVTFGPSVAVIKLADDTVDIPIGLTANITGWGETRYSEPSRDLQQVSVSVSPPDDCSKFFNWMKKFTDKRICVEYTEKGARYDDEGGPLIVGDRQIGILSYNGATYWERPNVYEKVAPHLQWIRNKIKQNL